MHSAEVSQESADHEEIPVAPTARRQDGWLALALAILAIGIGWLTIMHARGSHAGTGDLLWSLGLVATTGGVLIACVRAVTAWRDRRPLMILDSTGIHTAAGAVPTGTLRSVDYEARGDDRPVFVLLADQAKAGDRDRRCARGVLTNGSRVRWRGDSLIVPTDLLPPGPGLPGQLHRYLATGPDSTRT